ncbi:serine/threonine-protein kinase [Streptomyces sp. NPDC053750]|uniref:serine/threonine-protein kinase n=1 Tax=Streptomyces sp. NPDC053750 TaxID=3365714 RepID=UPI0037D8EF58
MAVRGELLGGRYRLVRQLGEGGMGQVWEAQDESLGRPVAVKVISLLAGGGSHGTEARARFLREARITARLQHPNIVTIHDVGETSTEEGKVPFLVMELVRGEGLDVKLRKGVVTSRDAARWCAQVGDALEEAHGAGIMHRDIKPSNILVSPSGIVKVLDFGIARAADPYATADRLTQTGFIVGTPPYMAPEQARGFPEPRSDLYALGCLLFELLTSRLPFEAPDTVGYLSAHLTQEPPAPSSVSPGIPSAWDDLVLTLLRKEPGRRHGSAAVVARALRRLDHAPGNTPPPTMPGPTPDRPTDRPTDLPSEASRAAGATITLALLCIPGFVSLIAKTVGYLLDPSAPKGVIAVNMVVAIAEAVALCTGILLLFRRKTAGRRLITATGSVAALHCLSTSVQFQVVGGPADGAVIAYVMAPLTAAAAIGAAVMAVRPSTARWCRSTAGTGSGTGLLLPPLRPSARTALAVAAVVCLAAVPVIPVALGQAVGAGAMPSDSRTVKMTLFGVQTTVFVLGLLLLLARNAVGRWLIATGGLGLLLVAVDTLHFSESIGTALRGVLPLVIVAAALSAALAVLPSLDAGRQQPR